MTRAEAETEALRRWPRTGHVFDREVDPTSDTSRIAMADAAKRVGRYWVGEGYLTHGNGNTWEEAFAAAGGDSLEETFGPKLTPKEVFDKLTRVAAYLHRTERWFVSDTKHLRNLDVISGAKTIIQIEQNMQGMEWTW